MSDLKTFQDNTMTFLVMAVANIEECCTQIEARSDEIQDALGCVYPDGTTPGPFSPAQAQISFRALQAHFLETIQTIVSLSQKASDFQEALALIGAASTYPTDSRQASPLPRFPQ